MSRFRPCIDLLNGRVVQIVGGSLSDDRPDGHQTNFQADKPAAWFAELYRKDKLTGGHVITLGKGNETAARSALKAYPGGLQMGGGITPDNALSYLETGASHVIVTSYVFYQGKLHQKRLDALVGKVGKNRLVLDLSCRKRDGAYYVVTDRWQTFTSVQVSEQTLAGLSKCCDEFLVHGVDVEGKKAGIEEPLVEILGAHSPLPVTYAGGIRSMDDIARIDRLGKGRVDYTVGSALDIFGGTLPYADITARR